ncbi:nitroreductase family protein [Chryseotalea sanaruensis]|uniref:Nitroreductase family protein n=1 Tax=Chryseotalea sanaruensis TaxID=2482724 RepID=A0A401U9T9_9BACT|nr:nitroreductase family protein [Chryseotalea sanaruensis]GCC51655.1 nitroreductase family protein [Chryseotalea sanaruensis]
MNPEEKIINGYPFLRYYQQPYEADELIKRSQDFYTFINQRRTVRDFSSRPIPKEVIQNILLTASSAPSGAHKQPWTFCVVSNPEIKKQIRAAAEQEEFESYNGRMSEEWKDDLKALATDWHKPFLETAPYLIIVFKKVYDLGHQNEKRNNYYVTESTGLACGFLLTAIHNAGLVALTHTPSPMNFVSKILKRPENERPFLLIPVGYAAEETYVPKLERKSLDEFATFYE